MKKGLNIKDKSTAELVDLLTAEKSNLVKLEIGHAVTPIDNPLKIRSSRRLIAKLNTELRGRQLAEQAQAK